MNTIHNTVYKQTYCTYSKSLQICTHTHTHTQKFQLQYDSSALKPWKADLAMSFNVSVNLVITEPTVMSPGK